MWVAVLLIGKCFIVHASQLASVECLELSRALLILRSLKDAVDMLRHYVHRSIIMFLPRCVLYA